jgi:thioesterase domain-containing protein/acyl carrier protein
VQPRGHRVELGEVEAVLRQAPGVKDAAVVLRSDPGTPAQLVGYYVLGEAASTSTATIRKQLSARLPSYMVPAALVAVPALRRTSRGKLDRESLPRPQLGAAGATVHEAPRTPTEARLADLWQRLLGKDRVGRADDFFALGGHSLLAVKLVDAIERELSAKLRLADIFQSPTLEGMAAALAHEQSADEAPRWRCLEEIHDEGDGLPLFFLGSTAQARSIAAHLGDERPVYGLNIFGLHETGQQPPRLEIADLARQYLAEIRAVRPHGPYCLAGYCEDAKVAMEVGWQLQAAGEQVASLLLIDAVWFLQRLRPVEQDPYGDRIGRARRLARNVQRFGLDFVRHRLDRRRRYVREDLRLMLCELETRVRRLLGAEAPLQLEHRVLITRYYEALGRYQAPDYQGVIHLYVAEEWGLEPGERLPVDLAVQAIAGYHDQILEGAGLMELVGHMRRALAEADRAARAPGTIRAAPSVRTG